MEEEVSVALRGTGDVSGQAPVDGRGALLVREADQRGREQVVGGMRTGRRDGEC